MTDHVLTLQTKVFEAMEGSTALEALTSGIYDTVPEKAKGTYVEIGDLDSFERGHKSGDSWRVLVDLHVWSDKTGKTPTHNVLAVLRSLLHETALDVSPYTLTLIREKNRKVMTDVGDELVHGIITFEALMEA